MYRERQRLINEGARGAAGATAGMSGSQDNLAVTSGPSMGTGSESNQTSSGSGDSSVSVVSPKSE